MKKVSVFAPALAFILGTALNAHAVSLTLSGNSASLQMDNAQVVYGSDSNGESQVITAVGLPSPDDGKVTEVGVPSMMPDGRVLFGAEIQPNKPNLVAHWNIYIGDPDAPVWNRVVPVIPPKALTAGECTPAFRGDPYPVADAEGNIAFISAQGHGRDALFIYSHGELTCPVKAGQKTSDGHEIAVLGFGSQQMGDGGDVVFNAFLNPDPPKNPKDPAPPHRQALLLLSKGGVSELAVEGDYGPNHTQYQRPFGLPAAVNSTTGTMIAFTAKTPQGGALFVYNQGTMTRILPTGTLTPLGPITYVSPGRPGLMADGTTAVLAGCARTPAIFRLNRQHLDVALSRGELTPIGTLLESLGDPVLTANGSMLLGATDSDGREKLYMLDGDDTLSEVGESEVIHRIAFTAHHRHSIFTGTLSANQHGDFTYLGGK
ncbi:MAG TPA: hypothetical protein VMA09_18625 [Candidatus Binataceae bacterium]|nr:hypothetical protein [Candidatus Binataceae bacterium]